MPNFCFAYSSDRTRLPRIQTRARFGGPRNAERPCERHPALGRPDQNRRRQAHVCGHEHGLVPAAARQRSERGLQRNDQRQDPGQFKTAREHGLVQVIEELDGKKMQEVGRFLTRGDRLLRGPDDAAVVFLVAGNARLQKSASGALGQGRRGFGLVAEPFMLEHEEHLGAREVQAREDLVQRSAELLDCVHRSGNRAIPFQGLPAEYRGGERPVQPGDPQGLPAAARPPPRSWSRRGPVAVWPAGGRFRVAIGRGHWGIQSVPLKSSVLPVVLST